MEGKEFGVYVARAVKLEGTELFDLFRVLGNNVVTRKGYFENGELVGYIPENAVISHKAHRLIQEHSLITKIPEDSNRKPYEVRKPYKCCKETCMGFIVKTDKEEGTNIAEELEIKKIKTVHPDSLVRHGITDTSKWNHKYTISYNITHLDSEDTFPFGEEDVIVTEKIHGTWVQFCFVISEKKVYITSKGYAKKGAYFHDNTKNEYTTMYKKLDIEQKAFDLFKGNEKVFILGEVFGTYNGRQIQDMTYFDDDLHFRVFDIHLDGSFVSHKDLLGYAEKLGIFPVPTFYVGPYKKEIVDSYVSGKETVSGKEKHTREGIVIKSSNENYTGQKRKIFKVICKDYYNRRHGTEYN